MMAFPHFLGAMYGKHILIEKRDDGSCYLNYKITKSSIAVGVLDYECLYADFGAGCDDRGVWK